MAVVYPKIKETGVFPLINIQKKYAKIFVKELDGTTCQKFSQQCIHSLHCRVLPADHRQSQKEGVAYSATLCGVLPAPWICNRACYIQSSDSFFVSTIANSYHNQGLVTDTILFGLRNLIH